MRDRLFDLIAEMLPEDVPIDYLPDVDAIVDRLLEAGAILPPLKVGQRIYYTNGLWVSEYVVESIRWDGKMFYFQAKNPEYKENYILWFFSDRIGETVFTSREAAEKALAERREG